MKPLHDRVAIVTGAASGLGEAIAYRLGHEGAHVVVADVDLSGAQKVAANLESRHAHKALALCVDVTDEASVEEMARATVAGFGRLDLLVANAGVLISGGIVNFATADWREVIDINLTGYFLCAKHAARTMIQQRSGVILQINSKSGKRGSFRNSAYAASKFGGIGLTQSLALELAPYNVRINAICPGNVLDSPLWVNHLYKQYAERWQTSEEEVRQRYIDQVPLGRGCTYDDVANAVVFLASEQASYMTGQAINVTGGQEMG
jgi:sorbitol-6-phosphate 2-dehydrogenase